MLKAFVGSPGDLSFKDGLVLKHLSKHWLVLKIKWGGVGWQQTLPRISCGIPLLTIRESFL